MSVYGNGKSFSFAVDEYNTLKNPAAVRLSRFALKDSFVIMPGEIKCSFHSRLISCWHDIMARRWRIDPYCNL